MEERNIKLTDGSIALFKNESHETRSGFAHCSELIFRFIGEDRPQRTIQSAYYLNRTWEAYRFQSVMRSAVYNLVESRKESLLQQFKNSRGYKQMTKKRREAFAEEIKEDKMLSAYRELMDALNYQYSDGSFSNSPAAELF